MIVDWIEASQGNPYYDVAKTYILLNFEFKSAAEIFLKRYLEKTETPKKYIEEWLPIAAASQLKYAKNKKEKDLLLHWIDVVE